MLQPGSRHLLSDSQSPCRGVRLTILIASSCLVNPYSPPIFLLFRNPNTFFYLPTSSDSFLFPDYFFFSPLFQVLSSLGDQTSVCMLTVSLALVFHPLNLDSWIAVSFQLFYWLQEFFSPVFTLSFHSLQSLFAFHPYIHSFLCLASPLMNFMLRFSLPFPLPNSIPHWFSCFLSCDVFHCFTSDCNQSIPFKFYFFFSLFCLAAVLLLPWFTLRTRRARNPTQGQFKCSKLCSAIRKETELLQSLKKLYFGVWGWSTPEIRIPCQSLT